MTTQKGETYKLQARLRAAYRREKVRHEKSALLYGVVCGTRRTVDTVVACSGESVTCLRCQKLTGREIAP